MAGPSSLAMLLACAFAVLAVSGEVPEGQNAADAPEKQQQCAAGDATCDAAAAGPPPAVADPLPSDVTMVRIGGEDIPLDIIMGLALFAFVVVGSLVIMFATRDQAKTHVLFLGLPNSGKTSLFYRLLRGSDVSTQTSMLANEERVTLKGKARTVVDYPGHHKLRHAAIPLIHNASAIVFCMDSIDWEANLSSNAEYLVEILTDPKVVLSRPKAKLAVACTKRDVGHSYKSTSIKKQLEAEIEKIRKTKVRGVTQLGQAQEEQLQLGVQGEKFSFDKHSPLDTTFIDVSGTETTDDSPLWAWVNKSA